jgi:hypothetical protein
MLAVLVFDAIARRALAARFGLVRPPGMPPFEGSQRVAFHLDQAIALVDAAALATTAIVLFARRRWLSALPGLAGALVLGVLVGAYPSLRGEPLRRVYLACELAALAVCAGSIVVWAWRRERPTPARVGIILVCLVDAVTVLWGAQRGGYWSRWDLNAAALTLLYTTLAVLQVISWRIQRSS